MEQPFNLKGGRGVMVFFWKNILILVEEKKIIWFRVFVIYPNVKFWKKNLPFARQKIKYSNSCVVRKKIFERNKKP
jgi:hypothetical protein